MDRHKLPLKKPVSSCFPPAMRATSFCSSPPYALGSFIIFVPPVHLSCHQSLHFISQAKKKNRQWVGVGIQHLPPTQDRSFKRSTCYPRHRLARISSAGLGRWSGTLIVWAAVSGAFVACGPGSTHWSTTRTDEVTRRYGPSWGPARRRRGPCCPSAAGGGRRRS